MQERTNQSSLKALANLVLYEKRKVSVLEGEGINDIYVYGKDIFVGDIVQFRSDYGVEGSARITEYVFSQDISGTNNYPTFEVIGRKE